jgi:protein TonB
MYSQHSHESEKSTLSERFAVVSLVVLVHLTVFVGYRVQPDLPSVIVNEMSISFANTQSKQADITPPLVKQKSKVIEPDPVSADEPAVKEVAPSEPLNASPPSPVQLDAEPDYRAEYLNNPRPPYPMVARRMGYNGRVILNVEVLSEGKAGQVQIYKSSGYEILDKSALQTVKTWKFLPAKRLGQPVTQWFLVPIKFSLEDNDA